MEILLLTFLLTAAAGWGDRSQLLAAQLSARYGAPGQVVAGTVPAIIVIAAIGASGGALLQGEISAFAIALMTVLALAFAGIVGLIPPSPPGRALRFKGGAILSAAIFGFAFASGGRAQLLILALAARAEVPALAFAGGAAGMIAAAVPAALLGAPFLDMKALRTGRRALSILFLIGAVAALVASR